MNKSSFYQLLGLPDYAPPSEIARSIATEKDPAPDVEQAIAILGEHHVRAVYDSLLRAFDGAGVVTFGTPEMRLEAMELARTLGFSIQSGPNEHAFNVSRTAKPTPPISKTTNQSPSIPSKWVSSQPLASRMASAMEGSS